jgi:hypothetical protein
LVSTLDAGVLGVLIGVVDGGVLDLRVVGRVLH